MPCELLGLVQYTNIFWQNTGPAYEPELLRAVAIGIQTLVRDFANTDTTRRYRTRFFEARAQMPGEYSQNYLKKWLIVEVRHPIHSTFDPKELADSDTKTANPTESVPAFTQVIANLDDSEATTIPPFSPLCDMMFDESLESLLSAKGLWLVKLKMTSEVEGSQDTRRHVVMLRLALFSLSGISTAQA
ncbi:unnamed protein product [Penicillium viridicatum]